MRLWLLDNSSAMSTRDSHRIGGSWEKIEKLDDATRWEELMDCVAFHADMTAKCWIPTKFCVSYHFDMISFCLDISCQICSFG